MGDVEKAYEADGIEPKQVANGENGFQSSNASEEKESVREEEAVRAPPIGNSVDAPPDGGYGWVCVACVFFINMSTWGLNSVSALYGTLIFSGRNSGSLQPFYVCVQPGLTQYHVVLWCVPGSLPGEQYISWCNFS